MQHAPWSNKSHQCIAKCLFVSHDLHFVTDMTVHVALMVQDEPERLGEVVASLQAMWGLKHIYCWHGLAAYWSGVATGHLLLLSQSHFLTGHHFVCASALCAKRMGDML